MMQRFIIPAMILAANPAFAASGPFLSLRNTDFVVLLAFILFVAVLLVLKVPAKITGMLDDRAKGIQDELEEARALKDEAQALLASYERKKQNIKEQSAHIIEHAKQEAAEAAELAKADLEATMARRMKAAEEQIAQAEARAVREVRDQAVGIAVAAAQDVVAKGTSATEANKLIDQSIKSVGDLLH